VSGPAVPIDVVRVRRGPDPLPLPRYMSPGAAGMDILADLDADVVLGAGERRLVPTGLTIAIPAGFEGQVRPRSGLAARDGVTVLNGPGTIDSDYRGEVQVLLVNLGAAPVRIRRGDRIAQLVVAPVANAVLREVDALPASERGAGGFGSTGAGAASPGAPGAAGGAR
jgi:dUTP pyrophosphatase